VEYEQSGRRLDGKGAQVHIESLLEIGSDELDVDVMPERETLFSIIVAPITIVVVQNAIAIGVVAGSHGATVTVVAHNTTWI